MLKSIVSSLRQAFGSHGFGVGVIGTILCIFFSSVNDILSAFRAEKLIENGFHAGLISAALSSDAFTLALPILCVLPYTTSFVDDVKSGFIKEYLPRTTVRNYLTGKIVACALSGGAVLAIGVAFAYAMSALTFTPMEATLKSGEIPVNYLAEITGKVAICMFSGAFWSVLGMTFAALTNSRYMAYASPFVVYYVLIILHERYFPNFFVLYPKEWLNSQSEWMFGNWGVVLLLTELTVLASFCFWAAAKKRLASI
jgi:hypothetical protein